MTCSKTVEGGVNRRGGDDLSSISGLGGGGHGLQSEFKRSKEGHLDCSGVRGKAFFPTAKARRES
jgi:hypothetical protein